jgi:hypothetical protein
MCAEPVRGARCGGGSGSAPATSLSPLARWVIGAVLITMFIAVGRMGFFGGGPPQPAPDEDQKADVRRVARRADATTHSAARLLREFQTNPDADQKYKGKHLDLFGAVERTGKDQNGTFFVILYGADERAELKIECLFNDADPEDETRLARLRKGQTVALCGLYVGRSGNLQIRDCFLID